MSGRRTLVTGTDQPLGAAVATRLRLGNEVVAIGEEFGYDDIADLVMDEQIDTIIHAGLVRWCPQISVDVIATMRIAAAASQPASTVRNVIVASSTMIYPASSDAPRLHRESQELEPSGGSVAAGLVEAEGYVRSLAEANSHLCVAILRLADLGGLRPQGPLSRLLRGGFPALPAIAGFDPPVQLLDLDDAAAALDHAAERSLAGVYNVAGDGQLWWSAAARLASRRTFPVAVSTPSWMGLFAHRIGVPLLDPDTSDTLRFGRVADTAKFEATGFTPTRSSTQCASDARPSRYNK